MLLIDTILVLFEVRIELFTYVWLCLLPYFVDSLVMHVFPAIVLGDCRSPVFVTLLIRCDINKESKCILGEGQFLYLLLIKEGRKC